MQIIGIYGASGFGREVMPLCRDQFDGETTEYVFVDDGCESKTLNGAKVVTYDGFLAQPADKKKIVIAISDSKIRKLLLEKCEANGIEVISVRSTNCVVMDDVELGVGAVLSPFVTLTSNIRIGLGFHANIYSYVAHDCVIGDYVTFAPGVMCNGNVVVEDGAYIGTGAVIKQGRPGKPLVIGEGAVVGMGAVVTKSVAAGETVVGNPAKPLGRKGLGGK
jgi:sugar O-acyltransferase (sialic acid O-acetyltransferase NeuD family)